MSEPVAARRQDEGRSNNVSASFRAAMFWVVALVAVFLLYSFFKATLRHPMCFQRLQVRRAFEDSPLDDPVDPPSSPSWGTSQR